MNLKIFSIIHLLFFALTAHSEIVTEDSSFHIQSTAITQAHPDFSSPYAGKNSLLASEDPATSYTLTFYLGRRLFKNFEFYLSPELAGGQGLSQTLGVAGYVNGEIYRVDSPTAKWNLSRLFVKQTFEWGDQKDDIEASQIQMAERLSSQRLTFVLGKIALNDYFDNNSYSHEPRTQFFNWALMDYGAWDYAADTRGYTWGLVIDYNQKFWALRYALAMEPEDANQLSYDRKFPEARGENFEYEQRYQFEEHPGIIRFLIFNNHAHMGDYRRTTSNPVYKMDISQTRAYRNKFGFGLSLEQEITNELGIFSRLSYNDGHSETWAFTEIDQSESIGASLKANFIRRPKDVVATSLIMNHISGDHIDYLNNGGTGILLGDGRLSYNPEVIWESYYSYLAHEQIRLSLDYQYVTNPAYNSDRGPVSIFGFRVHYEI